MKYTLTIEVDEFVLGDELRYPVVAAMLRQHAADLERCCGGSYMFQKKLGYGPHRITCSAPDTRHEAPKGAHDLQASALPAFGDYVPPRGKGELQ